MGFFERVKKATEAALDLSTGELDVGVAQNVAPVEAGPNAWTLEEIARLEARHGRAIVQSSTGVDVRERGSRTLVDRTSITLTLRLRLADGSFGPRTQHSALVPRDATLLLTPGTEIPVLVDPASGALERIDTEATVEELRPRFAEARAAGKAANRRGAGFVLNALKEAASDLRGDREPAAATVEGVTADQWLLARRALGKRPVPDAVRDRVLDAYGVPTGRWEAVNGEWSERALSDPALAARLAQIG